MSSSVLHERFQTWQQAGIFARIMKLMVKFYNQLCKIKWEWQSIDSKSVPAPLGGSETGKNPTDRGKKSAKLHILVDHRVMPLSVYITGANEHDKWSADDIIISIVVKRPKKKSNICVWIKAMIMTMYMSLSRTNAISPPSNIGDDVGNPLLTTVHYPAKPITLPGAGSLNVLLVGSPNDVAFTFIGLRNLRIGKP
ncbi:MAG: hypothetical protein RLP44_08355 [Aggregatilineales bacterium]